MAAGTGIAVLSGIIWFLVWVAVGLLFEGVLPVQRLVSGAVGAIVFAIILAIVLNRRREE